MDVFAIEGPDFSGKTTVSKHVVEALKAMGNDVLYVKEPDTTSIVGDKIYEMLFGKWGNVTPFDYMAMFAASRLESRARLLSLVEKPEVVILDRSELSTMVYQTICLRTYEGDLSMFDLDLAEKHVIAASKLSGSMLPVQQMYYLDTPLGTCLKRLEDCENPDDNERPDKVKMSFDLYNQFLKENHFDVVRVSTAGSSANAIGLRIAQLIDSCISPF
jgi:thymidylate kinase